MPKKDKDNDDEIFKEPEDNRLKKTQPKEEEGEQSIPLKMGKSVWGSERIEVPNFDKVKNKFPLPDGHVLGIICGASGSGKSYMLLSVVPQFGKLSQVMIHSLIIGNPVYMAVEAYCKDRGIKYGFSSNPEDSKNMIEEFISEKPDNTWALNVFDDFNQGSQSRTNPYNQVQIMSYMMLRNYSCHSFCITQNYTNVNTLARNNCNMLITFHTKDKYGIWSCAKDFENLTGRTQDEFMQLYKQILPVKHSYILVSDDKVYIHIPKKTEGLEEVDFGDSSKTDDNEEDTEDKKLSSLVHVASDNPTKTNLKNLVRYIKVIANEQGVSLPKMIKHVNDVYNLDIEF